MPDNAKEEQQLERLVFFSDAVFAIAITLLALDVRAPAAPPGSYSAGQLADLILGLWPKYLSYVISFLVIGLYWMAHHRYFGQIRRYDSRLIWLNLLFLMGIAFIPYPTSMLGEYGTAAQPTVTLYAAVLAATGLLALAIWRYASHDRRLTDPDLSEATVRAYSLRAGLAVLVFLSSIVIAVFNPMLAAFSWALVAFTRPLANLAYRGADGPRDTAD
jgi:uncharacterized membrane protein